MKQKFILFSPCLLKSPVVVQHPAHHKGRRLPELMCKTKQLWGQRNLASFLVEQLILHLIVQLSNMPMSRFLERKLCI